MFRRELLPWALLGLAVGLVEGATVAVLVKKGFAGLVAPHWVNFAVAVLSGAPALANISSFAWANLAHGRARISLLVGLQTVFALIVGLIAFTPFSATGLVLTLVAVIVARLLWAGVLTVRAAVWTSNYPRGVMARITGRFVIVAVPGVVLSALAAGWVLDRQAHASRWLYGAAAACGLLGAWYYRAVRVRREYQLLAAEADASGSAGPFSLHMLREILRSDAAFRSYMFWMSLYGAGNLMMNALLVVLYTDHLGLSGFQQIMLLSVVPLALIPVFIPWWARLFDRGHVIKYRSRQCWALVTAIVLVTAGVWTAQVWLLWLAAVMAGAGYAGANLGWNLGHNDFASLGRAQHYMGVHVTLTGVRGLIAPPLGIACYQLLEKWRPDSGMLALLLPLGLVTTGGLGFVRMNRLSQGT